ncbi:MULTISPECIES: PP2C family protein-serine/threonine phosphatase [Methylomonas]|uniref:PP2C family protein-serine/threonine phosphatase n=1 Tax=Methylomonas TaxID=416 RepID=UPI001232C1E6|nr:SpoIIE family protein phosphatase [Methylomonas rhizoryzae]
MRILIVDDILENRLLLERLLTRMRHQVLQAENGQHAVDVYTNQALDLILMDVMMPVMNGFEAIQIIRALPSQKWVPIFLVSALTDVKDIIEGLKVGADDYLPKPIDYAILSAKIDSVERTLEMQRRIIADTEQLRRYREQNEREHDFLQAIFERLLKLNEINEEQVQYWLTPAQRFSGDLVCAHKTDQGLIYFMLADSTGHGLAAALPTVIVNQVFRGMAKKSLSVKLIAREINGQLYSQLPPGRFVALTLGVVNEADCSIEIWNGGLPEGLLIADDGSVKHAFRSLHTFAGVLDDESFDDSTEYYRTNESCELFLYSDGVIDATNRQFSRFGTEKLRAELSTSAPGQRVDAVRQALEAHMVRDEAQDDVSCLAIRLKLASSLSPMG